MAVTALLTLGGEGIITDPQAILLRSYRLAQVAERTQSVVFSSNIFSIQYLGSIYGNEPLELCRQLESGFKKYLSDLFPDGVNVSVKEKDPGQRAQYTLSIDVSVQANSETFSLFGSIFHNSAEKSTILNDAVL